MSDAEIISIFIGSGSKGLSAIDLAQRLIQRHGSLAGIGAIHPCDLAKEHGIGPAKATRMSAAFEFGARVARQQSLDAYMDSPEAIHGIFAPQLQHLAHEHVMVAVVDCKLRHLSSHQVSIGSVNESIAHPRDILRPVISRGGHGFVLVHNHPSGDPQPSQADREITQRIRDAAEMMQLRFIDHLIVGRSQSGRQPWYSFRESCELG